MLDDLCFACLPWKVSFNLSPRPAEGQKADKLLGKRGRPHDNLPAKCWRHLYEPWYYSGVERQITCYLIGDCLIVTAPDGVRKIRFGAWISENQYLIVIYKGYKYPW